MITEFAILCYYIIQAAGRPVFSGLTVLFDLQDSVAPSLVGATPQRWRSWCQHVANSSPARWPYLRMVSHAVRRLRGLQCRLTKKALPVGFMAARSASHALITRSSSPRSGCVVDSPFL